MRYLTNQEAQLSNTTSGGSRLTIDARSGSVLNPGFEVKQGADFQILTDGCPE